VEFVTERTLSCCFSPCMC